MGKTNFPDGITDAGEATARVTETVTLAEAKATIATGLASVTGAHVTLGAIAKGETEAFTASATPSETAGSVEIEVLDVSGEPAEGEVPVTVTAFGTAAD